MISTILIDRERQAVLRLREQLTRLCQEVRIDGSAFSLDAARRIITDRQPQLLLINLTRPQGEWFALLNQFPANSFETIILSDNQLHALQAIRHCVAGFVLKPVQESDLLTAIQVARRRLKQQQELKNSQQIVRKLLSQIADRELIGVPTLDGYEFLRIGDIIRCEGLQRCTRIICHSHRNIVSAYNLGEFKKLLDTYGFFLTHKSHLVNLRYIKSYSREGTLLLIDDSQVPVARRRKEAFLDCLVHI